MTLEDCKRILLEIGCPACGLIAEADGHTVTATANSGDGARLAAEYVDDLDGEPRRVAIRVVCNNMKEVRYINPQVFALEELAKLVAK